LSKRPSRLWDDLRLRVADEFKFDGFSRKRLREGIPFSSKNIFEFEQEGTQAGLEFLRQFRINGHLANVERDTNDFISAICLQPRTKRLLANMAFKTLWSLASVLIQTDTKFVYPSSMALWVCIDASFLLPASCPDLRPKSGSLAGCSVRSDSETPHHTLPSPS
jgi:hypothetical protein